MDIDAELVARARASLAAAGYPKVEVRCADGGYGDPAGAPFDRIIVTAGAWDIAPAWLEQLTDDGRLVLPLSVRGIELSVALDRSRRPVGQHVGLPLRFRADARGLSPSRNRRLRLDGPDALVVQVADGAPGRCQGAPGRARRAGRGHRRRPAGYRLGRARRPGPVADGHAAAAWSG